MNEECEHLAEFIAGRSEPVLPSAKGCEECLASGDPWVHRHATNHYRKAGHPVIKSFEPGESWGYCYPDELMVEAIESFPEESPPVHYSPPAPPHGSRRAGTHF
jgi:hypothetical protein